MNKRRIPTIRGDKLRTPIDLAASVTDVIERIPRENARPDGTDCTVPLTPSQESFTTDSSDAPWGP